MTDAILRFDGLSFDYVRQDGARLPIFRELTLDVQEGEFVCVVGPSGCGKSTLLRLASGLLQRTGGELHLAGHDLTGPSVELGMVFQSDALLPWRTALENVIFGIESRLGKRRARPLGTAALERVGLSGFASSYPHQLSGGMRQRVNLARAMVHDPKVLLMDEPFAALDAQTRERMQQQLLEVWDDFGKTVLFVTHQIDEAVYLGDRVIVLGLPTAGITATYEIDIDRPRGLDVKRTRTFVDYVAEIWSSIESDDRIDENETLGNREMGHRHVVGRNAE